MKEITFKIKNEFSGATVARTIRFTENLFEQLNQIAVTNDISFNLLVLQCCRHALDNYEGNSKDNKSFEYSEKLKEFKTWK